MNSFDLALSQLDIIEAAVKAGDLEAANAATQKLKPLLVSERVDEIAALKARVDALTMGVRTLQSQGAQDLKLCRRRRRGLDAYQMVQSG